MLRVVRGEQHAIALGRQLPHQPQDAQLIAVVQRGGRLVHHQDAGLLRNRAGHQHQLLLAAGEMREVALRQLRCADPVKRVHRLTHLRLPGLGKRGELTRRAHEHGIQHRIAEGGPVDLRNIGDPPGHLPARQAAHILAIREYAALIARQQPQDAAEQRALAHAVGAEHGEKLAPFKAEGDVLQHQALAVGEGKVLHAQAHSTFPLLVIR